MRGIALYLLTVLMYHCGMCMLAAQPAYLSKAEMQHDLAFLTEQLRLHHPNLYTYSSGEDLENWLATTSAGLGDSIATLAAFKIVGTISGILKDGHSYSYPSAAHLDSFFNNAPLFPLDVFLAGNELVVTSDNSAEQAIPAGSKLLSINGASIADIQANIVPFLARDGDNLGYPRFICYQFFPAYYSYFYGFQKSFLIELTDESGNIRTQQIQGQVRSRIRSQRAKNETNKASLKGIFLHIDTLHQLALLRIRSFDNSILKADYGQHFKREIKAAFARAQAVDVQHLVIDLRDNQGGELSNGIYLLQQFMHEPFQAVAAYFKVKNDRQTGARELRPLANRWDNYFTPFKQRFTGKIYVFTNGGSFSCSSIVANAIKENKRGLIMGAMTGGSAYVNAGAPNQDIVLPASKILFTIPKIQYCLRKDLQDIGDGVVPDIEIPDDAGRILGGKDSYLEVLRAMISH